WQVPHFLAIAWIYRDDYRRAGLCMLPVFDHDGRLTARMMSLYALTLIPASFAPVLLGVAGPLYLAGALALGGWFWLATLGRRSLRQARRVLRVSLIYLPGLLALLLLDHLSGARLPGM